METLEIAFTPLFFVSGMSLFLLVLTNRFTTLTTRALDIVNSYAPGDEQSPRQLFIRRHPDRIHKLVTRIEILKASIFLAAISIAISLAASGLVLFLSTSARDLKELMLVVALSALASVVLFLLDILRAASNTRAELKEIADIYESANSRENVSP
ncbi:MAG: DUF2721 domain-containing protein [Rhodothermales bacterium]